MNRIAEVTMYSTMYGFAGSLFYITVTNYTWKKIKERLNNVPFSTLITTIEYNPRILNPGFIIGALFGYLSKKKLLIDN